MRELFINQFIQFNLFVITVLFFPKIMYLKSKKLLTLINYGYGYYFLRFFISNPSHYFALI